VVLRSVRNARTLELLRELTGDTDVLLDDGDERVAEGEEGVEEGGEEGRGGGDGRSDAGKVERGEERGEGGVEERSEGEGRGGVGREGGEVRDEEEEELGGCKSAEVPRGSEGDADTVYGEGLGKYRGERMRRERTIDILRVTTESDRLSLLKTTLVERVASAELLDELRKRREYLLSSLEGSRLSARRQLRPRGRPSSVKDRENDGNVELARLAVRLVLVRSELTLLLFLLRLNRLLALRLLLLLRTVGSVSRSSPSTNSALLLSVVDGDTKDLTLGIPEVLENGSDGLGGGSVAVGGGGVAGKDGETSAEVEGGTEGEKGVEVEAGDFLPAASRGKRSIRRKRRREGRKETNRSKPLSCQCPTTYSRSPFSTPVSSIFAASALPG
jgi:hypothetical protein